MLKFFRYFIAEKQLVADSSYIKSGYSAGRSDASSSGQWYKT